MGQSVYSIGHVIRKDVARDEVKRAEPLIEAATFFVNRAQVDARFDQFFHEDTEAANPVVFAEVVFEELACCGRVALYGESALVEPP